MTRTRIAAMFVSGVLALVACAGGRASPPEPRHGGPPICDAPLALPTGFEPTETFKEEYPDRVGVRLGYADEEGRELHAFAGIPGDFGEGLPDEGNVELVGGATGRLLGGPHQVWVVSWDEGDACDPRAVLGSGFDRLAFLDVLEGSGLVAP
jgi:hypothetical protein